MRPIDADDFATKIKYIAGKGTSFLLARIVVGNMILGTRKNIFFFVLVAALVWMEKKISSKMKKDRR